MLSFSPDVKYNSFPIAKAYNTKDCVGKPIFSVYYIQNYSNDSPPEIISSDSKSLLINDRFRIMKEFSLSKKEFNQILDRVVADEAVIETSSRTLKRAYLEIQRIMNEKLKKCLEFATSEKVFLKPVYNTMPDRKNQIVTLFGSSGAGKSHKINDICMRNPAIRNSVAPSIYLFSSVGDDDPSYKPIKNFYGERFIWIDPREVKSDTLNVKSYKPKTVLIFDDINSISDKRVRAMVVRFRNNCLEIARHNSLVIISSEHLFHNRAHTQKLRNSSAYLVLYPRNSPKPIDDVLETQMNYNRHERTDLIKKVKREGRAQFIHVDRPPYLINEKRVQLF